MTPIQIVADPSLPITNPGNGMEIQAELVPGTSMNSEPQIGLALTVNDGTDEQPPTEMYVRLPLAQALELAEGITGLVRESDAERLAMLTQALEFKSAQLSCAKGSVGALEIVKIADSDRGNAVGFGFYDLFYSDDSGDNTLLHHVTNVECYVPFTEEEQYEWLRALVGGNHQYTASIKISLDGFNLEEIRNDFLAKIAAHHADHQH
jgi:hypothetical protein